MIKNSIDIWSEDNINSYKSIGIGDFLIKKDDPNTLLKVVDKTGNTNNVNTIFGSTRINTDPMQTPAKIVVMKISKDNPAGNPRAATATINKYLGLLKQSINVHNRAGVPRPPQTGNTQQTQPTQQADIPQRAQQAVPPQQTNNLNQTHDTMDIKLGEYNKEDYIIYKGDDVRLNISSLDLNVIYKFNKQSPCKIVDTNEDLGFVSVEFNNGRKFNLFPDKISLLVPTTKRIKEEVSDYDRLTNIDLNGLKVGDKATLTLPQRDPNNTKQNLITEVIVTALNEEDDSKYVTIQLPEYDNKETTLTRDQANKYLNTDSKKEDIGSSSSSRFIFKVNKQHLLAMLPSVVTKCFELKPKINSKELEFELLTFTKPLILPSAGNLKNGRGDYTNNTISFRFESTIITNLLPIESQFLNIKLLDSVQNKFVSVPYPSFLNIYNEARKADKTPDKDSDVESNKLFDTSLQHISEFPEWSDEPNEEVKNAIAQLVARAFKQVSQEQVATPPAENTTPEAPGAPSTLPNAPTAPGTPPAQANPSRPSPVTPRSTQPTITSSPNNPPPDDTRSWESLSDEERRKQLDKWQKRIRDWMKESNSKVDKWIKHYNTPMIKSSDKEDNVNKWI